MGGQSQGPDKKKLVGGFRPPLPGDVVDLGDLGGKIAEPDLMKIIGPAEEELKAKRIQAVRDEHDNYDERAYLVVSRCFDRYDLTRVNFGFDELMHLMKDPYGNMFRRPVMGGIASDFLRKYPVEPGDQTRLRDSLVGFVEGRRWDYFPVDIWGDVGAVMDLAKKDPGFARRLAGDLAILYEPVNKHLLALSERWYEEDGRKTWMTDPGHGLDEGSKYPELLVQAAGFKDKVRLDQEIQHLLVEDQVRSIYPIFFSKSLGYLPYPTERFKGLVPSGEEALETIEANERPPDVITADIMLGKGMNGLEFARHARELVGDKTLIYAYSSYVDFHLDELRELVSSGVLQGYFRKQGFDIDNVTRSINENLRGRTK